MSAPLAICEKLRRKEQLFPAQGGGGIGRDAAGKTTITSYTTDDGFRHVNPDGPEAADTLEEAVGLLEAFLKQHLGGAEGRKGQCCWEADAAIDFLAKVRGDNQDQPS